jgi:hypothetical protein
LPERDSDDDPITVFRNFTTDKLNHFVGFDEVVCANRIGKAIDKRPLLVTLTNL